MHKTPAQADVQRCLQWLEAELRAVAPSTVVALGRTALGAIERLAEFVPATAMSHPTDLSTVAAQRSTQRGRWRAAVVDAVAHPSALLRAGAVAGTEGYQRWREALRLVVLGGPDQA